MGVCLPGAKNLKLLFAFHYNVSDCPQRTNTQRIRPGGLAPLTVRLTSYALLLLGGLTGFGPLQNSLWAQLPAGGIHLVVVEGEGAVNNVKQRTARQTVVEVQDDNHKPIAGALVSFTLPSDGPSATFFNGTHLLSVTTDAQGRAVTQALRPNKMQGKFQINVRANYQGQSTTTTVAQSNALLAGAAVSGTTVAIIAVAGAAAAGLAVGLTKALGGGSNSARVSVGTPTVGAP